MKWFFKRAIRTLPSITAYQLWAHSYTATPHNALMSYEQESMLALMPRLAHKTVLDLACGTGRYGKIALERGAKQIIGIDNSFAMLERATLSSVYQAEMNTLPLADQCVDVVLCGLALGHLPTVAEPVREIARILRPQGVALISDFHPLQFLSGAKRTFTAPDGRIYAVEHYVHLTSTYWRAFKQAGLEVSAIEEPLYQEKPVVVVYRVEKRP